MTVMGYGSAIGEECLMTADEQFLHCQIRGGNEGCELGYIDRFDNDEIVDKMSQSAIIEKVNFFKQLPFFSYWNIRDLRKICFYVSGKRFKKNQMVYQEGTQADLIYFVKQGEFVLNKKIRPMDTIMEFSERQNSKDKLLSNKQGKSNTKSTAQESDKLLNFITKKKLVQNLDRGGFNNDNVSTNLFDNSNLQDSILNKGGLTNIASGCNSSRMLVQNQTKQICVLGKNEVFGEEKFFGQMTRIAEVRCISQDGEVYQLLQSELKEKLNTMAHNYTELLRPSYEWRMKRIDQVKDAHMQAIKLTIENSDLDQLINHQNEEQNSQQGWDEEGEGDMVTRKDQSVQNNEDNDDLSAYMEVNREGKGRESPNRNTKIYGKIHQQQQQNQLSPLTVAVRAEEKLNSNLKSNNNSKNNLDFGQILYRNISKIQGGKEDKYETIEQGINQFIEKRLHGSIQRVEMFAKDKNQIYARKKRLKTEYYQPQFYLPGIKNVLNRGTGSPKKSHNNKQLDQLSQVDDIQSKYRFVTITEGNQQQDSIIIEDKGNHYLMKGDDKAERRKKQKNNNAIRIIKLQQQVKGIQQCSYNKQLINATEYYSKQQNQHKIGFSSKPNYSFIDSINDTRNASIQDNSMTSLWDLNQTSENGGSHTMATANYNQNPLNLPDLNNNSRSSITYFNMCNASNYSREQLLQRNNSHEEAVRILQELNNHYYKKRQQNRANSIIKRRVHLEKNDSNKGIFLQGNKATLDDVQRAALSIRNFNNNNPTCLTIQKADSITVGGTSPSHQRVSSIQNTTPNQALQVMNNRNLSTLSSTINQYHKDKANMEKIMIQVKSFSYHQQIARARHFNERTAISKAPAIVRKPILHPTIIKSVPIDASQQ